eukprot:1193303-Prorocentrum_minimum.AAC.1
MNPPPEQNIRDKVGPICSTCPNSPTSVPKKVGVSGRWHTANPTSEKSILWGLSTPQEFEEDLNAADPDDRWSALMKLGEMEQQERFAKKVADMVKSPYQSPTLLAKERCKPPPPWAHETNHMTVAICGYARMRRRYFMLAVWPNVPHYQPGAPELNVPHDVLAPSKSNRSHHTPNKPGPMTSNMTCRARHGHRRIDR